ncbi:MAG: DUF5610 domain-containing protein [Gemmatimonadetes bacterium]|jgi:hypothetical protein|nr:DUF5610 domain-containing protein [Gemmatimonadota bacterium]MBT5803218.1 DUF5610 domain-containing protein [Gemmatimonadota bacterium]MBT6621626.1 DUF5610 domain-containing protein [Gemmatimonadota bacterium]MBT6902735.1 DUF5610 domain-containing protein [Gemmatimonadota bacterium]MBT7420208.1 DUF5610 domain-containing protein [Gemmatimonadota bacterium]
MNIGSSPSQTSSSFTGSIDITRTAFQMQQTLTGPDGEATRTLMVDAVEVNIQIDGKFAGRVLQDSMADKLNAAFAAVGMDTTVDSLQQSATDFSPQATAQRIVNFSTSFFGSFQQNHADEAGQSQASNFAVMIKGAIEEGFASAQDILVGLGEIAPDIQAGIDETFGLTMQGINSFVEQQSQEQGEAEDPTSIV